MSMGKPAAQAGGSAVPAAIPAAAEEERSQGWPAAVVTLTVGLAVLLAMFGGTVSATVSTWLNTGSYNHGLLIAPVVLFLVWERREALARLAPHPSVLGVLVVAAASLVWTLGSAVSALIVQQFALVGMIWGLVLAVVGPRAVWQIAFPLAYLVFAVPFGDFLVVHLQDVTAWMTVGLLRLSGVPVFSDGVFLQTAFGAFEVAEACAGLRFLTACLAFGTLFAWQFYHDWKRRLLFVLASAVVPVIANGLRAYGIVILTDIVGPSVAGDVDHVVYGWLFFSFVMALMAGVGWLFREPFRLDLPEPGARARGGAVAVAATAVLALAASAILPGWLALGTIRDAHASGGRISIPLALTVPAGWQATEPRDWQPVFVGDGQTTLEGFAASEAQVERAVAWFANQQQGSEVVNRGHDLLGERWERLSSGPVTLSLDGKDIKARELRLGDHQGGKRIVWVWYWVDGTFTGDERMAKLLQARALLVGRPDAGAILAVSGEYRDPLDAPAVTGAMRGFVAGHTGLGRQLRDAAAGDTPALAARP